MVIWLVVSTHLKNISQIGSFPQVGVKIKNIWNHHLVVIGVFCEKLDMHCKGWPNREKLPRLPMFIICKRYVCHVEAVLLTLGFYAINNWCALWFNCRCPNLTKFTVRVPQNQCSSPLQKNMNKTLKHIIFVRYFLWGWFFWHQLSKFLSSLFQQTATNKWPATQGPKSSWRTSGLEVIWKKKTTNGSKVFEKTPWFLLDPFCWDDERCVYILFTYP